jgi:hypothetical protein
MLGNPQLFVDSNTSWGSSIVMPESLLSTSMLYIHHSEVLYTLLEHPVADPCPRRLLAITIIYGVVDRRPRLPYDLR